MHSFEAKENWRIYALKHQSLYKHISLLDVIAFIRPLWIVNHPLNVIVCTEIPLYACKIPIYACSTLYEGTSGEYIFALKYYSNHTPCIILKSHHRSIRRPPLHCGCRNEKQPSLRSVIQLDEDEIIDLLQSIKSGLFAVFSLSFEHHNATYNRKM